MNTSGIQRSNKSTVPTMGSLAHFGIFIWALFLVVLTTDKGNPWILLFGLLVLAALYPKAIKRLARFRWILIFAVFFTISVVFGAGSPDQMVLGVPLSSKNMISGLYMIGRALVILLAADGLTSSIDITEVAGLFERVGLSGLGFSLGVAVNLIPNLRESITTTWHSLKMRGGLRSKWWRGMQLFFLTVVTNALRRSEEIVLAAEARAFSPEKTRKFALCVGRLDWAIISISFATTLAYMLFFQT